MLADAGVLDYERSLAAFRRIARRCALGDAAADDTELSEEHSRLRADADWLGLKVWARRRDARLRASMDERIQRYVAAAEPGTLVSLFRVRAHGGGDPAERPGAVLADGARRRSHRGLQRAGAAHDRSRRARARARRGPRGGHRPTGRARSPASPTLPSCAPACSTAFGCGPRQRCSCASRRPRRSGTARRCRSARGSSSPSSPTTARARLPQANRFAPDLWLDGSADADWQMNVFSRGGAQCAGRNLALLLGTASLAELLRQREFELLRPKLAPDRPLPYGMNPLNVRFAVR